MIFNRKTSILFLLLIFVNISMAQVHQWANLIDRSHIGETLSVDSNNNTYMTAFFQDSTVVAGKTLLRPVSSYFAGNFLAKFNKDGKLLWVKTFYTVNFASTGSNICPVGQVKAVTNNRIIVYGIFSGAVLRFTSKDSLTNPTYSSYNIVGYMAEYDSSGNFIKCSKVYEGIGYELFNTSSYFIGGHLATDGHQNLYIHFYKSTSKTGSIKYKTGSILLKDSIYKSVIVKYSPDFDSVLWYKEFPDNNKFHVLRIRTGEDNNLYLVSRATGSFALNSINYKFRFRSMKGFLAVLSPSGIFIHAGVVNSDADSNKMDYLVDVAAKDTNNIYICGYVADSIRYQSKWYTSLNKKPAGAGMFPFVGLVSTSKGAKWINLTNNRTNSVGTNAIGRLNFDKYGNVFYCFTGGNWSQNSISLGGLTDSGVITNCFAKLDSLGNALWLQGKNDYQICEIEATSDTNIVYTDGFSNQIKLTPFTLSTKKGGLFLAKLMDYSITRGNVSSGPYCAGDTIIIPYKKRGVYDSSNYFVAELSDEKGRFEGKERELGRVKSMNNGTVKGKLPLFQVVSSGQYRIRIRSTNPVVQSFYKVDKLRLLIYSKDKANPGPTETICYGDSVLLNTYGGTKWTWSPNYNVFDSSQRQTMAWPKITTTYKIIIGDSSGCGVPDTAYKKIIVRPDLKIVLAFNDTTVCGNEALTLPYKFQGGDSVNYKFQWYFIYTKKDWFPLKKGEKIFEDTLRYQPTDPKEKLAIVLKDGCTDNPDTAYVNIEQRTHVLLKNRFRDTSLCSGLFIQYSAIAGGGLQKQYVYQWKDLTANSILSTTDSLKLKADKTLKIQLTVNDGCEALGDTALFEVKVKAELKALSNLRDTTICYGQKINYTATAQGGDSKAYKFYWVLNNKLIDSTSTFILTSALTSTLSLILKDNCTIPNDTIKKTITVKPSPKADFSYDLACSKTITKFQFTGTKPTSPIITSFRWNFNNEATSSLENPSHKFAAAGTSTTTLILACDNGCSDTMKKVIIIKPQSIADFTANDVCETDSAVFINKSQDATSYNWRFGDGQTSNLQTPKHKYHITGTTTFNVSLVAVVANGCSDSIGKAISINSNPNSNFTHTLTGTKVDLKATVQGNTKYQWKFGSTDSTTTTSGNYTFNLTKPEQYKICLKVTNLAGCISQTCKDITVGISQTLKPSGFKIYPNPNNGNFTIEIENPANDVSIEVYSLIGELVKKVEQAGKVSTLDLETEAGIYLVRVKNGGMVWNEKIRVF